MAQLTKKMWNSLTPKSRAIICDILDMRKLSSTKNLIDNGYYHDFDYNREGRTLKFILSCCRVQSDGTIDVVITITPEYLKEKPKKQKKQQEKLQIEYKRYYIDYNLPLPNNDVDLNHCWVEAESKEDAIREFRSEYGSKPQIIQVTTR